MDTKNKCSSVDEGSEKEGSNCCCCAFLKRQSKHNADDHGKVDQEYIENNKETVAVQEPPVTQQPMTSQSLHVPDQVSSGPQTNQNGTVNPSESNSDHPNSLQQNTQDPKTEAMPNKYKSVKEYMKVENFMNEF